MPKLDYQSVHWYSKNEWKLVYDLIFGPESDVRQKKKALNVMQVWKMRNPYLPAAIESTLNFLEVDLKCPVDGSDCEYPERNLRFMYSAVIMRFINHTLDAGQMKRLTLFQAADQLKIPQWIVDLRHETAHGHELPPLPVLRNATSFALNWLHTAYWEPYNAQISNFTAREDSDSFRLRLSRLMNLYNSIALCQYSDAIRIRNIPVPDIRENVISDFKQLFLTAAIDDDTNLQHMINSITEEVGSLLHIDKNFNSSVRLITEFFADEESPFLMSDIIEAMTDETDAESLPLNWIFIWDPILTLLNNERIIPALLKMLIQVISKDSTKTRCRMAAKWIREISLGFDRSYLDKSSYKQKSKQNYRGLILNRSKFNTDAKLLNELLQMHPYLNIYAEQVLKLFKETLPQSTFDKLTQLVSIVAENDENALIGDYVYTMEDIKSQTDMDVDEASGNNGCIWSKAAGNHDWGMFPIGTLPWQSQSGDNPLLQFVKTK